jgi:hypothetical protein
MPLSYAGDCPYPDFTARYIVRINGITVANTDVQLRTENDDSNIICHYQEVSTPVGFAALISEKRFQTSTFSYGSNSIQSLSYSASQKGGDEDKNVTLDFLWDDKRVVNSKKTNPWSIELPPGTLDMLTMTLGIAEALKNDEKTVSLLVATRSRIKTYEFGLQEQQIITVLGKDLPTLLVKRTDDKKDQSWMWFAPQYHFIPVKYEKKKKGGVTIKASLEVINFGTPERSSTATVDQKN